MGGKKAKYKNRKRKEKKEATFAEEKKGLQNIWLIISQSKTIIKMYETLVAKQINGIFELIWPELEKVKNSWSPLFHVKT